MPPSFLSPGWPFSTSYVYGTLGEKAYFGWYYMLACAAVAAMSVVAFQAVHLYAPHSLRSFVRQNSKLFVAWTIVFGVTAAGVFLLKQGDTFSRVWFVSWYVGGALNLAVFRVFLALTVRRWANEGRLDRRAVIVGENAEKLIKSLKASKDTDVKIAGIFDDRGDDRSPPLVAGFPKLGNIDELVEFGRQTRVDLLIVSLPITAESRILQLLEEALGAAG